MRPSSTLPTDGSLKLPDLCVQHGRFAHSTSTPAATWAPLQFIQLLLMSCVYGACRQVVAYKVASLALCFMDSTAAYPAGAHEPCVRLVQGSRRFSICTSASSYQLHRLDCRSSSSCSLALCAARADKSALQDFHYWLIIFNYEAPCGSADAPPLRHVLQVLLACATFGSWISLAGLLHLFQQKGCLTAGA